MLDVGAGRVIAPEEQDLVAELRVVGAHSLRIADDASIMLTVTSANALALAEQAELYASRIRREVAGGERLHPHGLAWREEDLDRIIDARRLDEARMRR